MNNCFQHVTPKMCAHLMKPWYQTLYRSSHCQDVCGVPLAKIVGGREVVEECVKLSFTHRFWQGKQNRNCRIALTFRITL